jgi:hypothetical protein
LSSNDGLVKFVTEFDECWGCSLAPETNDHIPCQVARDDEFSANGSSPASKNIPHHGVATFSSNNNAHPIGVGWASINDQVLRDALVPSANHLTKVAGLNDSIVAGKHRDELYGDFAAALAATGGEDRTSGAGAHTQTEAVHLGAAAVVGLVSTLRHFVLLGQWPAQSG